MITLRLQGGLGNQMFAYATAKSLAERNHTSLVLDINAFKYDSLRHFELDKYNIDAIVTDKFYFFKKTIRKLSLERFFSNYYVEKSLLYDDNLYKNVSDSLYLEGYFQSEKYFKNRREKLLEEFCIKGELSSYTQEVALKIKASPMSVSLHIRRGDYVANEQTQAIHGSTPLSYYKKSMLYLEERFGDVEYFIFSDDIEWVQENLKIQNAIYVKNDRERIPHEDIYLMSLCHHNIIANSSFSWWGAWLNNYDKKIVIAPKRWFVDEKLYQQSKDIVCESWIQL